MRKIIISLIFLWSAVSLVQPWSLRVVQKENIDKKLKFLGNGPTKILFIDNIYGSINVSGFAGNGVHLFAEKTIKGRDKSKIELAKQEVKLLISEKNNSIELYVDGPFREKDNRKYWDGERRGYLVQYDFQIKVPNKVDIFLKTINNGDIFVENIDGHFTVKNVNGEVKINGISGAGEAHTVNGDVGIVFTKIPSKECSFRTVNGDVELEFPQSPSAKFMLKTFNGGIFTDFDFRCLPSPPLEPAKRINGKFVYKTTRFQGVQFGHGGPEIKIDTFNGDILILKKK